MRDNRPITRRSVLGITGLTVLTGGIVARQPGDDVTISIDDECSTASIEMHPPNDEVWTGTIEYLKGSEVARTPAGGQTVTGGGSGSLQVSLSSPNTHVRRAFVVEGTTLEGPVVAEKTCELGDDEDGQIQDGCGTENDSAVQSRSTQVDVQVNVTSRSSFADGD